VFSARVIITQQLYSRLVCPLVTSHALCCVVLCCVVLCCVVLCCVVLCCVVLCCVVLCCVVLCCVVSCRVVHTHNTIHNTILSLLLIFFHLFSSSLIFLSYNFPLSLLHSTLNSFVTSLRLNPYNWSCWLDLSSLCHENANLHARIEGEVSPQPTSTTLTRHFLPSH